MGESPEGIFRCSAAPRFSRAPQNRQLWWADPPHLAAGRTHINRFDAPPDPVRRYFPLLRRQDSQLPGRQTIVIHGALIAVLGVVGVVACGVTRPTGGLREVMGRPPQRGRKVATEPQTM